MRCSFYGHACLRVDGKAAALLCDPWFSSSGAFFGSWHPYPRNDAFSESARDGVSDLLVSHNHEDHFDRSWLAEALAENPQRSLHIARFATPWFARRARAQLGAQAPIVEHEAWEPFGVGDLEVFFIPEESPAQVDSAIVVRSSEGTLINLNDSRLTPDQLERARSEAQGPVTLALQASGASEYPLNYDYAPEDMLARCREKRRLKFEHCERVIDAIAPDRLLFFAGPPAFLAPELRAFNDLGDQDSVFPDQAAVLDEVVRRRPDLRSKLWFLLPGESFGEEQRFDRLDRDAERFSPYRDKAAHIASYAADRDQPFDLGPLPDDAAMEAHFLSMATLHPYFGNKISGCIDFRVEGREASRSFGVDFSRTALVDASSDDALYRISIPASCLAAIIAGEQTWDDAFLSLRMRFEERSDRFVAHFKTLLKYMDAELCGAVEGYERALAGDGETVEMMEIEVGGTRRRVQRRCPHAGADLSRHGELDEAAGTITCMAHRFCFDVKTGRCDNAEGYRLVID